MACALLPCACFALTSSLDGALEQYPHEREICFGPLTGLEVHRSRVEGSVLVLSMRLNVNLQALTIEQVVSKRRKLCQDMCANMEAELQHEVHGPAWAALRALVPAAPARARRALHAQLAAVATHAPQYYNDDHKLGAAIRGAVDAKSFVSRWPELLLQGFHPMLRANKSDEVLLVEVLEAESLHKMHGFDPMHGFEPMLAQASLALKLREVNLAGNKLTDAHFARLCGALRTNDQIRIVDLSLERNLITDLAPLIELLGSSSSPTAAAHGSRASARMSVAGAGARMSVAGAGGRMSVAGAGARMSMAAALGAGGAFRGLDSRTRLDSYASGTSALEAERGAFASLRRLDLSQNKLTSASLRMLADALPSATELRRINVLQQKSFMRLEDAQYLVAAATTCIEQAEAALAARVAGEATPALAAFAEDEVPPMMQPPMQHPAEAQAVPAPGDAAAPALARLAAAATTGHPTAALPDTLPGALPDAPVAAAAYETAPVEGARPLSYLCPGVPALHDHYLPGSITLCGGELSRHPIGTSNDASEPAARADGAGAAAAAYVAGAGGEAAAAAAASTLAATAGVRAWQTLRSHQERGMQWRVKLFDEKPPLQDADALLLALSIRSAGAARKIAELDLTGHAVGDAGIEALAAAFAARPTRVLRRLTLSCLPIGSVAMHALSSAFAAMALVELHLGNTKVGSRAAMAALCERPADLAELETLGLQRCGMLGDGLALLTEVVPRLPRLRYLTLDSNTLGHDVVPLLHAGTCLESLSLQDCAITESDGLAGALSAGAAPRLMQLALGANSLRETATLVAAAQARWPPLELANLVEASPVAWRKS